MDGTGCAFTFGMSLKQKKAYKCGYEAGINAGTWAVGPSSDAKRILQGIEDGDPEIMDMQPAPLSGEWAGESINELSDMFGVDLHDDDKASDFEIGFSDGYWNEVERSARAVVGDLAEASSEATTKGQ